MAETLTFSTLHLYDTRHQAITLPVSLTAGNNVIHCQAKLDTGSSLCVFPRKYGEVLGFDIETGQYEEIGTATGALETYGHWVTVSVLGIEYETIVYFAKYHGFNRNIMGRQGWLNRIRLGLIDHDGKLYLSEYNDPA